MEILYDIYLMVKNLCYNRFIKEGQRMAKRLTRDVRNKKIAGVCAGIANYFDIDTTNLGSSIFCVWNRSDPLLDFVVCLARR